MQIRIVSLIASCGLLMLAQSASAYDPEWRSSPPITYVLDYGYSHLDNPDYIAAVATAPPTLLHLGKDVVMSHNWGPIQGVGGENQAGGKGDAIRRLTPEETWERYRQLEAMVDGLHAAGVRWVMPYICSVTIGGHHERRTGFWEFYDHWDEYREFGLPPRPELDPADWMQRLPDGTMKPTYGSKPDVDEFYPAYEPNLRYAACVNNPGWRTWIDAVVRLVAAVGYDGAFIDNGSTQQCYCEFCTAKYQDYLRERYTDAEIATLFGAPAGQVPLSVQPRSEEPLALGWVESQRFWRESIYDHQQAMKRAGEEVSDHFILFPNGGHNRPETVNVSYRDTEFVMYELSIGDYGTNPGRVRSRIVDDIYMNVRNNNIWELKYTQATRNGVSALLLTRGGYPGTRAPWALNELTAALGHAESAAFGSGAGFLLRPSWAEYGDVLNQSRTFFETNADLYTGLVPYAQIGVAAFGSQSFYENDKHSATVEQLVEELTVEHVLFDLLTEEAFVPEVLAQFDTVIFPNVRYATSEQIAALEGYVRDGGRAIIIGPTPTHDERVQPLSEADLPEMLRGEPTDTGATTLGAGEWLRLRVMPLEGLGELLSGEGEALSIAPDASLGVRFNAFINPDADSPLVLHVVNYDTPLGAEPEPLVPHRNIALSVPLPEGAEVTGVRAFSPDADPQDLPFQVGADGLHVTLPELRVYTMLRVDFGG
ncbi:MAG: hypothetical protein GX131_08875 [candidate division WS1 bacterium]|nr:hypothetical protein [candidate division WS1 bacterium]